MQFEYIKQWVVEFVTTFTTVNQITVTDGSGIGENGSFEGLNKYSYHSILHTEHYLDGESRYKAFKMHLLNALYMETNEYLKDGIKDSWAVDTSIYGINQQFKFPCQSKQGSDSNPLYY